MLFGFRNRAWLKWKYRPQRPWLVLAFPPEFPRRPWPAQDPWVCSPLSTAQARLQHPPALLLQSDMGTLLCLSHHQVAHNPTSAPPFYCFSLRSLDWYCNVLYCAFFFYFFFIGPPQENMANPKEKTPMCLVNELARFNRMQPQYKLLNERGPAHAKVRG